MAESADHLAGVTKVVGVAAEWRIKTQFTAFIGRTHVLVYRVHGLQNPAAQLLELAQFDGLLHAVVFQVLRVRLCPESP